MCMLPGEVLPRVLLEYVRIPKLITCSLRVTINTGPGTRGPGTRGPGTQGPEDPRTRGPEDRGPEDQGPNDLALLHLAFMTQMQLVSMF